jgi:putative ABC transport system ATP-binding protein
MLIVVLSILFLSRAGNKVSIVTVFREPIQMMTDVILKVENLTKTIHDQSQSVDLYHDVNLSVTQGESVALLGPSGTGKSTLLSILAGLEPADSGEVWIKGQALSRLSDDERAGIRARHLGFVFQSFMLVPGFSAIDNLQMACWVRGIKLADAEARAALKSVELEGKELRDVAVLSGGEQQRVALARAMVSRPDILLADEPTGNLDTQTGAHIAELLMSLNRDFGTTLLLATHDHALAQHCQRQLHIENGGVHEQPR